MSSVADSIALITGGFLMLIPGYLTDIIGLFLFVPGLRTLAGIYFITWITTSKRFSGFVNLGGNTHQSAQEQHSRTSTFEFREQNHHHTAFGEVIEGDFEEKVSPKPQLQKNQTKKF